MQPDTSFVDIHCHLIPGIDDGARSWDESLAMARMAVADGVTTIVATPHQLGAFSHVSGERIRNRVRQLQEFLRVNGVPLSVLAGADVRVDSEMIERLATGDVVTLADRGRHLLLELPHELYFPLDTVLEKLRDAGIVGILSHPERNRGLLKRPALVEHLIRCGCLMQVTASSLAGTFGPRCQEVAERMITSGWIHFIASDAHSAKSRRPLLSRAFARVRELTDWETAQRLCSTNPRKVVGGLEVPVEMPKARRRTVVHWFLRRKAG